MLIETDNLTDDEWQIGHELVIIYFYSAENNQQPDFAAIYNQLENNTLPIVAAKIDVNKNNALAEKFCCNTVPHLIIIKHGLVIFAESGYLTQSFIKELISQAIQADVTDLR